MENLHSPQTEQELKLLIRLSLAITSTKSLNEAFQNTISEICKTIGWELADAWLVDTEKQELQFLTGHCRDEEGLGDFCKVTESITLQKGQGLPGQALESKNPVWLADFTDYPGIVRKELAKKIGIKSAFAVPVLLDGEPLAILAFYSIGHVNEKPALIQLVAAVAGQLGLFLRQKQTEESLSRTANEYQRIFDFVPALISISDLDTGRNIWINRELLSLLGYTVEEIRQIPGDKIPELIHPDDRIIFAQRKESLKNFADDQIYTFEIRVLHKQGNWRWLRGKSKIFKRNNKGEPVESLTVSEDITELKEKHLELEISKKELEDLNAELEKRVHERTQKLHEFAQDLTKEIAQRELVQSELRENAQKFRFLADAMPQKVWTADGEGEVNYFNNQWLTYTGRTFEELKGWGWRAIIHPDDIDFTEQAWRESINTGKDFQLEHRFLRGDGKYRWHLSRGLAQKTETGKILMWVGTNTDIEEQKRNQKILEEKVRETELLVNELEAKNEELNQFANIVSHDLKAPLRTFSTLSTWILDDEGEKISKESRDGLQTIIDKAAAMSEMIQGILEYSRAGAKRDLQSDVELGEVIQMITKNLTIPANIKLNVSPGLPVVRANKTQLEQVFQNLLDNAIKYMDKDQGLVKIDIQDRGQEWEVSISDNGPGIDPQELPNIFRMFYVSSEHSGRKDSTGVGLAICKKIIESNGGKIWAESEAGKGTTFYFTLRKSS